MNTFQGPTPTFSCSHHLTFLLIPPHPPSQIRPFMRGHDVIQRAASRPTPHLSVIDTPRWSHRPELRSYSMWSHRSRCVRRSFGGRGCVETIDCTAVTLRKMSCSVPIYLASFVWTIHLTESCSIDFRQKTEMVETSLCVSHPGANWEMMDMNIRELDSFIFLARSLDS